MKKIHKILLFCAIFFLMIGFASISSYLYINGNVTVGTNADEWDIYFSSAIVDGVDKSNKIISKDRIKIIYNIPTLKKLNDKSVLDYEITNASSHYDASVSVVIKIPDNIKNKITLTNELDNKTFYAKTKRNGKLTIELTELVEEEVNTEIEIDIIVSAVERTSIAEAEFNEYRYSLSGYLVDSDNNAVKSKKIVIIDENDKTITSTDRYGYFYIELERGLHDIYLPKSNDPDSLTADEIKANYHTLIEMSTNQSGDIVGKNGYKILNGIGRQVDNRVVNITLNTDGGEISSNVIQKTENNYYRYLEEPVKSNYDFVGWYEGDKLIDEDVYVVGREDKILTAHWEPKKYTLTFNANGGTLVGDSSKLVQVGSTYGELPTAKKTDNRFIGWYTVGKTSAPYDEDEFKSEEIVDITQDEVLYAQYTKQCDTFSYPDDNNLYHIIGNKSYGTDTCNGIDYGTTLGRGVFTIDNTKNNTYPIHFFRENVNNNYIKLGNMCFRLVRTTDTGGVKAIYNGLYDDERGTCRNSGDDVLIATDDRFNNYRVGVSYDQADNAYVGYMFGSIKTNNYAQTHANSHDSTIKYTVEAWYRSKMLDYDQYIEDTVYCNDRSVVKDNTWASYRAAYNQRETFYAGMERLYLNRKPSLVCENANDRFTYSSSIGNGKLGKKVGLLTADEASYGGLVWNTTRRDTYLWGVANYWLMTPNSFYAQGPRVFVVRSDGGLDTYFSNTPYYGVRPVISFKPTTEVIRGAGYANDPFIIEPDPVDQDEEE